MPRKGRLLFTIYTIRRTRIFLSRLSHTSTDPPCKQRSTCTTVSYCVYIIWLISCFVGPLILGLLSDLRLDLRLVERTPFQCGLMGAWFIPGFWQLMSIGISASIPEEKYEKTSVILLGLLQTSLTVLVVLMALENTALSQSSSSTST